MMAESSISPAMLQQWIAQQQAMKAMQMGGMPQPPSGIEGASQMLPGAPSLEAMLAQPTGGMGRGQPSLMDMMQAPQAAPTSLLDMMGGSQPGLQSLAPPPMAMMSSQAPTPAGLPSFRNPPQPAMMSPELAAKRKAPAAEYTIKKGDTLTAIAKRNGTTVKALLAKNPQIKNADKIFVGKKIKL